jgi:hypothetical protein
MGVAGGPDMIERGLVLSLDASDRNSYPGSGTTWFDLSGNNRNFTLINSPLHITSSIAGYFNFDGINEYATLNIASDNAMKIENYIYANHTYEIWFNLSTLTPRLNDSTEVIQALITWPGNHNPVGINRSSPTSSVILTTNHLWPSTLSSVNVFATETTLTGSNANLIITGSWVCVHDIINYSTTQSFTYVNGVNINTRNQVPTSSMNSSQGNPANTINIGAARDSSTYRWYVNNGGISSVRLYNTAMSAEQVLQNYNAQKSKFGL